MRRLKRWLRRLIGAASAEVVNHQDRAIAMNRSDLWRNFNTACEMIQDLQGQIKMLEQLTTRPHFEPTEPKRWKVQLIDRPAVVAEGGKPTIHPDVGVIRIGEFRFTASHVVSIEPLPMGGEE